MEFMNTIFDLVQPSHPPPTKHVTAESAGAPPSRAARLMGDINAARALISKGVDTARLTNQLLRSIF